MTEPDALVEKADLFAADLTEVVNGTACTGQAFETTPLEDAPKAWVWPVGSTTARRRLLPIFGSGDSPRLWLNVWFRVRLNDTREHLAVETSVFALCIDERSQRPAVRIEYDRGEGREPDDTDLRRHRRSAAHVHVHGASDELAYAQAVAGASKLRRLDQLHIPVGGRRFRPTLEDFIEFLHAEELLPALHDGWMDVITLHQSNWLARQLRAAVSNDPATAAAQLTTMGYRVDPPSPS